MHFFDCHAGCHAAKVHELDVFNLLLQKSLYTVSLVWDGAGVWGHFDLRRIGQEDSGSFGATERDKSRLIFFVMVQKETCLYSGVM